MVVRNAGRALGALVLATAIGGCGGAATFNTQTTTDTATTDAATQATTIVITRTVVVTSTVLATIAPGSIPAPPGTTTSAAVSSATTAAGSTTTTASTASAHATPTAAPGGLPVADAGTVTLDFLAALEKEPSGASSLQYLTSRLQAVVRGGHSIPSIIGVQNMYTHYHADAPVSRGGGRAATVRVTLTYAAGPVDRLITLVPEGGAWRIDDIADSSA